jgi:hypothetical protein
MLSLLTRQPVSLCSYNEGIVRVHCGCCSFAVLSTNDWIWLRLFSFLALASYLGYYVYALTFWTAFDLFYFLLGSQLSHILSILSFLNFLAHPDPQFSRILVFVGILTVSCGLSVVCVTEVSQETIRSEAPLVYVTVFGHCIVFFSFVAYVILFFLIRFVCKVVNSCYLS